MTTTITAATIVLIVVVACAIYGVYVASRAKETLSGLFWMILAILIAVIFPLVPIHG